MPPWHTWHTRTVTHYVNRYIIGIGCRRGISVGQIDAAVRVALAALMPLATKPFERIRALASIDIKRTEPSLNEFAARHSLPLMFFSRSELAALPTMPSIHTRKHLGIDGVCEPCARLASNGGRIIVAKIALDGVTVAIAKDHLNTGTLHEN